MSAFEAVIGLEIHVQLATRSKLFCADAARFGDEANRHVCPVCLGLPGALPVTNAAAVELAAIAALGLDCTVHETSVFARKNYFYPDLPKGYQITQFDRPLATGGALAVAGGTGDSRTVRIRRIHLEEDAGKSLHDRLPGRTAIDLNRAGVPLVEIVTEPDLRTPAEARAFLTELKQILLYLEVSDCDMEKGSLRVDANVSVRPAGSAPLGTKTELKNMNSFANVERAVAHEVDRQIGVVGAGGSIDQVTLLWDEARGTARPMRSKEESHDYRYFPDPDLPPVGISARRIAELRRALPELPAARRARIAAEHGVPDYDAAVLTSSRALADYFEAVARAAGDGKAASNWVMTEVLGWLNQRQAAIGDYPIAPAALAELIRMVGEGTLSHALGRRALGGMLATGRSAADVAAAEGLVQIGDEAQLAAWIDAVLAAHPEEAARCRAGDAKLVGFLMGQVMRRSGGKADPKKAATLLRARVAPLA